MLVSVRSATSTTQGGKREYSLFGRYEKFKLVTENENLKAKIKALQDQLEQGDARKMAAAATAAAAPAPRASPGDAPRVISEPALGGAAAAAASAATRPSSSSSAASAPAAAGVGGDGVVAGGREQYRLTRELIRSRCNAHNIILVTFVNSKRADYGYTWAYHVNRLNLTNYLVGAMDGEALNKLSARRIPTFDMESGLTTADYGWGTKNFRQLGLRKTELIISLLRAGADPVLTDADALITRDPTPFIVRLQPEAQILVTSDHLMSTTKWDDDGRSRSPRARSPPRGTSATCTSATTCSMRCSTGSRCAATIPNLWDQNLFKDVLKIGGLRFKARGAGGRRSKHLFLGYNGTIAIGILPVSSFCSGHTYFIQRMPQRRKHRGVLGAHNLPVLGAVGKTHRLREAMLWADEPAYFAPTRGLLSYTPHVGAPSSRPSGKMDVASHFELVHHQLVQVRAPSCSRGLRRLLILPELVCGLDRFWAPANGTIPGSDTALPIDPCPADHVLDLENIARKFRDGGLEGLLRESSSWPTRGPPPP